MSTIAAPVEANNSEVLFQAAELEIQRALTLSLPEQPDPYWVEYRIVEEHGYFCNASLGAVVSEADYHIRELISEVRVGSYEQDNTNFDPSIGGKTGTSRTRLTTENNIDALRHSMWLSTDQAYKGAVEAFSAKMSALEGRPPSPLPDLLNITPQESTSSFSFPEIEKNHYAELLKELTSPHKSLTQIEDISAVIKVNHGTYSIISSEGTRIQQPFQQLVLHLEFIARANDGSKIRDTQSWLLNSPSQLPSRAELQAAKEDLASWVMSSIEAPVEEDYLGPVIMEAPAAAELFRQILSSELSANPPIQEVPDFFGETQVVIPSSRIGRRLFPPGWEVYDDPQHSETLPGFYSFDHQGVAGQKVALVEDGVVKDLLMSRIPRTGFDKSTGHGRSLFGRRYTPMSSITSIIAPKEHSFRKLKKQGLKMAEQAGLDYILVVRKITPLSLNEDFEIAFSGDGPMSGLTRPLEVYRLYGDGTEIPVRNAQFVGVDRRILRDIVSAGPQGEWLSVLDAPHNGGRYGLSPTRGLPTSWSAPTVLISEIEVRGSPGQDQHALPPPSLSTAQ